MALPSMLHYDSTHPLYGIAFSNSTAHPRRIALSSFVTGPSNKLFIVDQPSPSAVHLQDGHSPYGSPFTPSGPKRVFSGGSGGGGSGDLVQIAQANLAYPATKVAWEPSSTASNVRDDHSGGRGELVATTGDVLRIWEVKPSWEGNERGRGGYVHSSHNGYVENTYSLTERSVLSNPKQAATLPPITSFSWNETSPNSIVTCSIDTTATLWDINTSQALTQLIAHDRAVYDLSWLPQSSDIFVSVGADGSLRAFDLRQLEHSTILYETPNQAALARIAFSNREQHMLACFGMDESRVLILDMRSPGQPVAELLGHQAPVGAISWGAGGDQSSSSGGWLASCGDDCQLLMYDLTGPLPTPAPSVQSSTSTRPPTTSASHLGTHNSGATSINPNGPSSSSLSAIKASTSINTSTGSNASSTSYALSSPTTPSNRTPSPSSASVAVDIAPVRAWTAGAEINNLAFTKHGDWIGCVSGQRLSVLSVAP